MNAILAGLGLGAALSASALATWAQADDTPPAWAYAVNPPDFKARPDDGTPRHVPDSTAAFTLSQARDLFSALDWHPADHPPLPDIVAHGRKPDVMACGVCHRADGPGGPENVGIAGLPAQYIVQQMADFKSGARTTSVPQRIPPQLMIKTAKGINDTEIEQAATYFSGLKPRGVIKVVEVAEAPKTRVAGVPGGATGRRDRADRRSNHRGPGGSGALRDARYAIPVHRLRAAREHRTGPATRHHGQRKERAMYGLSWPRTERSGADSGHRRAVAELSRTTTL